MLRAHEKQLIGRQAAATVPQGTALLVDLSATVIHFLRRLSPVLSVGIVTAAVDVATAALNHPRRRDHDRGRADPMRLAPALSSQGGSISLVSMTRDLKQQALSSRRL
ncbi:hypothetical protein [Phyllobacterium endophyticum]|uniref:DeoR-like transcriptional repressor C-terminal sensor domain-containing protein n=1 Tax=Phyllobacterium endophyticum TaxID=1149773 RepID=A0A2P7AS78_9HYPH|nr:hypothetical protein CU100_17280 [Phyllobacterium endophyticum]